MRTFNVRLFAVLTACSVVFGVGVFFLHGFQVGRNAHIFFDRAEDAEQDARQAQLETDRNLNREKELWDEAMQDLKNYIALRPDDLDALEKLGNLQQELGRYIPAFSTFERLLRDPQFHDEERPAVRRKQVNLAMDLAQAYHPDSKERSRRGAYYYSAAKDHLEKFLLVQSPEDGELLELLGRCQAGTGEDNKAVESFRAAIKKAPGVVDAYLRLAGLLRHRQGHAKEADQCVEEMVQANPNSCRAHLRTGQYWRDNDDIAKAASEARQSLLLAPADPDKMLLRESLYLAAQCALIKMNRLSNERNREEAEELLHQAREYAQRGIESYPRAVEMYAIASEVELYSGQAEKAVGVLREGLRATKNDSNLLLQLANYLIEMGQIDEASRAARQLQEARATDAVVGYLRARIEYAQRHWKAAIDGFDAVRSTLPSHWVKQVDYWTGKSYDELGNPDQAQLCYRRALDRDPFYGPAMVALADSLLRTGKIENIENALTVYQKAARSGKTSSAAAIPLAQMQIYRNLRLPPEQRDWRPVEALLKNVLELNPDAIQALLLQAEVLAAQNRPGDAETLLLAVSARNPDRLEPWNMLVSLAQRAEAWDKAEKLLQEAEQKLGDRADLRLLRARYLGRRLGAEAAPRLRELAANTEKFDDDERVALWNGLLNVALQVNDIEQGQSLCRQIAEKQPGNMYVRVTLFDLAKNAADDEAMQKALKDIEAVEGKGPHWHYGQAMRLVMQAKGKSGEGQLLQDALAHLAQAREMRPGWGRVPLLTAAVYDQLHKPSRALENYLKALELGDYNTASIQRTAILLSQERRYTEALNVIGQLAGQSTPLSPELEQMTSRLRLMRGQGEEDLEAALKIAKKAAEGSRNFRDHVFYGLILNEKRRKAAAEGKTEVADQLLGEVETSLRRAVELEDRSPETWVPLIKFYGATEQTDKVKEAIAQAEEKLPPEQAALALAECYDAGKKPELAMAKYKDALKRSPDDLGVVRAIADFYRRTGKLQQAEAQLQRVIDGTVKGEQADVLWARRQLAVILVQQGGYQNLLRAQALVEQNLVADGSSSQDKRLRVGILSAFPTRAKQNDARDALENMVRAARESASPDDQLALVQMYLQQPGGWPKASSQLRTLLAAHSDNAQYLAFYVGALLDHGELQNAQIWLDRLRTIAPDHFTTVKLQAGVLLRNGKFEQALDALKTFVDRAGAMPRDRATRLSLVADALDQLSREIAGPDRQVWVPRFVREAELIFRRYVDERPSQEILLASFLSRQGQISEAIDLLERIWERSDPLRLAQAFRAVLGAKPISGEQTARAEKLLMAAQEKFGRPIPLLLILADHDVLQEHYKEAETLYREILQKDASHAVAMNNLVVLLAMRRVKLDEALRLVNRAIELAGPVASMLDTRASVYMALGQPDKALADLKEAIGDGPLPLRLFHQVQAYEQKGDRDAAQEVWTQAHKKGLTTADLHPLERPAYEELRKVLQ